MLASGGVFFFPIDKRAGLWYNGHIMADKGKFIVFEGTDGSGKSTQMKLLAKYLKGKGIECLLTHEPTDSPFGGVLRACLTGRIETDERAIAALFAADRLDHITNPGIGIQQHLDAGITVLCDRYYFSTHAYNGALVSAFARFGKGENIAVIASEEERDRTQANIRREVAKLFGGKL